MDPLLFHSHVLWIKQCTRDVSTSGGRPIDEIQVVICPCQFERYHDNSTYARQTYQSCSTSINDIIRRVRDIGPEEMWTFYKLHWLTRSCHSPWTRRGADTNDWQYTWTTTPAYHDKSSIIFRVMQHILQFRAKFRRSYGPLGKTFSKGQLQTFDRLTRD